MIKESYVQLLTITFSRYDFGAQTSACYQVSWSLTSLFSTNMAISETTCYQVI